MPTLALSGDLLRWLRSGKPWAALDWRTRAALVWKSGWSDLNIRLSHAQLHDAPPLRAPLLIVGPWRSGTTVMHELLTAATGLPTPLTWQCMNPSAFQLLGNGPKQAPIARPMDGLEIGAQSPQEDEFALLGLGVDSAYRAFLMPSRLADLDHTLDQQHWLSDGSWLPRWEAFLQGVLRSQGRAGERLILKSPNHTFRMQAILRRFPDAQVVWMSRDPADTFRSNEKMWHAMFDEHALGPAGANDLQAFLGRALQASADTLDWLRDHLKPGALAVCDQSELLADPAAVVRRVSERLQLPGTLKLDELHSAIGRTQRGKVDSYADEAPAAVRPALQALRTAQERAAFNATSS